MQHQRNTSALFYHRRTGQKQLNSATERLESNVSSLNAKAQQVSLQPFGLIITKCNQFLNVIKMNEWKPWCRRCFRSEGGNKYRREQTWTRVLVWFSSSVTAAIWTVDQRFVPRLPSDTLCGSWHQHELDLIFPAKKTDTSPPACSSCSPPVIYLLLWGLSFTSPAEIGSYSVFFLHFLLQLDICSFTSGQLLLSLSPQMS